MYNKKRITATLERLANNWNDKYWLFAADGGLYLTRMNPDGERIIDTDGISMSREAIVYKFELNADGGDW